MLNYVKGMYKTTTVNVTLSEEAWEASTVKLEPEKRLLVATTVPVPHSAWHHEFQPVNKGKVQKLERKRHCLHNVILSPG